MQTEDQCPASTRYLYADEFYTDAALKIMQASCVRHFQNRIQDSAYHTFVQWALQANEAAVFVWNAYADLAIPKRFNCIFRVDDPGKHLLISYELVQAALNIGGEFYPLNQMEHGHKHLCILSFEQEIPPNFELLHREDGANLADQIFLSTTTNKFLHLKDGVVLPPVKRQQLLGFCAAADLPAITAEKERTARLRLQYGSDWWKYDELSS